MNKNIDLTKILEGCPEGTKFYSTLQGEVGFIKIDIFAEHPIIVSVYNKHADVIVHDSYAKDGRYNSFYDGECTLFPSKDQRDWSEFEPFWGVEPMMELFDYKMIQAFDQVLVRNSDNDKWQAALFSHTEAATSICNSQRWSQCIPYNEENAYLVGTREKCAEHYKWWEWEK